MRTTIVYLIMVIEETLSIATCTISMCKKQSLSPNMAGRVLARFLKLLVQYSNSKNSSRPDLATQLLQILISTQLNNLLCQKGQFTLQPCPRRWLVRKLLVITSEIENS